MTLQQAIAKIEEIKAALTFYEAARGNIAKAETLAELLPDDATEEQRAQVQAQVEDVRRQYEAAVRVATTKTSAETIDDAVARLEELMARVTNLNTARQQELEFRTMLDVELELGNLTADQRLQAEALIDRQQKAQQAQLRKIELMLPSAKLIQLV